MIEKSGNAFQRWLKDGQQGVIVLHLLDCLDIVLISALIFGLLYLYFKFRDRNLPKIQKSKREVIPQAPQQTTLDKEIRLDVMAVPPKATSGSQIRSLDSGETSVKKDETDTENPDKPKMADTTQPKPQKKSDSKTKQKEVHSEKPLKAEPKKEVDPKRQSGEGLGISSLQDQKNSAKPKTGAQSGTENKDKEKTPALTANSDESVETLKLENETKD